MKFIHVTVIYSNERLHPHAPCTLTVLQVAETTEARVSIASSRKAAVVNTGATVMVPSFVQKGEFIIVTPSNGEFVSRAKS
jgi:hypothetical protein